MARLIGLLRDSWSTCRFQAERFIGAGRLALAGRDQGLPRGLEARIEHCPIYKGPARRPAGVAQRPQPGSGAPVDGVSEPVAAAVDLSRSAPPGMCALIVISKVSRDVYFGVQPSVYFSFSLDTIHG